MSSYLVQHLLISTALAAVIALAVRMLNRQSAALRYRLWFVAAAKFAVPLGIFVVFGKWLHDTLVPASSYVNSVFYLDKLSVLKHSGDVLSNPPVQSDPLESVLITLWLLGAGLCFSAWFLRFRSQNLSIVEAPPVAVQLVSELRRRLRLRRKVDVRSALSGGELALSGVFQSAIILPPGLCDSLQTQELEAVLMHELFHAKRWDNLAAVLVRSLVCVFWFHPGLWWIERRLMVERELACDEAVIDHGWSAETYLTGILKTCRFHLMDLQPGACGVSGSSLQQRMERIMSYTSTSNKFKNRGTRILGVLGAAVTLIPFAFGFFQAPALYGRATENQKAAKTQAPVTCIFADKPYLEGSIISEEGGHQQLCVEVSGRPTWVRTSPEMRERGHSVVTVKVEAPPVCVPKASNSTKLCSCEDSGPYSPGSVVNSTRGRLSCSAGNWIAYKPSNVVHK